MSLPGGTSGGEAASASSAVLMGEVTSCTTTPTGSHFALAFLQCGGNVELREGDHLLLCGHAALRCTWGC